MEEKTGDTKLMMKLSSHCSSISRETILTPLLLLAFIISAAIFYCSDDFCYISTLHGQDDKTTNRTISTDEKTRSSKLAFAIGEGKRGCDLFSGRWVRDYGRPLYEEWECPYLDPQVTCQKHGRPEKDYLYWRWQPHGCSIPSFNATLMLEALRGKRMMFVGDSLNRGQYTSMICLLHRIIPKHAKTMEIIDSVTVFTAKDYNATIEFFWAPFLLESNADDPFKHRVTDNIVRNGSIGKHGDHWKGAAILVFNSYIWWMNKEDAYRIAMNTLVKWINNNTDPQKTRVFFTSLSPTHQWSHKWGGAPKGNCYNETTMIQDPNFFGGEESLMHVTTEELSKSTLPITFLNITHLSSARKDAHTSIYKEPWGPLTKEQLANPKSYADCIHWCLPGLQDIWNELLFSKLFYP